MRPLPRGQAARRKPSRSPAASVRDRGGPEAHADPRALLAALDSELRAGRVEETQLARRFQEVVDAGLPSDDPGLVALAAPYVEVLARSGACKTLRKRLRGRAGATGGGEAAVTGPRAAVEVDPRVLRATEGRRLVVVGGDARGRSRAKLEAALRPGSLEWEPGWNLRRVQALRERIGQGAVDLLIVVRRFLNHDVSGLLVPACREAGVRVAWVEQGYGVAQVERAIQRCLERRDAPRA